VLLSLNLAPVALALQLLAPGDIVTTQSLADAHGGNPSTATSAAVASSPSATAAASPIGVHVTEHTRPRDTAGRAAPADDENDDDDDDAHSARLGAGPYLLACALAYVCSLGLYAAVGAPAVDEARGAAAAVAACVAVLDAVALQRQQREGHHRPCTGRLLLLCGAQRLALVAFGPRRLVLGLALVVLLAGLAIGRDVWARRLPAALDGFDGLVRKCALEQRRRDAAAAAQGSLSLSTADAMEDGVVTAAEACGLVRSAGVPCGGGCGWLARGAALPEAQLPMLVGGFAALLALLPRLPPSLGGSPLPVLLQGLGGDEDGEGEDAVEVSQQLLGGIALLALLASSTADGLHQLWTRLGRPLDDVYVWSLALSWLALLLCEAAVVGYLLEPLRGAVLALALAATLGPLVLLGVAARAAFVRADYCLFVGGSGKQREQTEGGRDRSSASIDGWLDMRPGADERPMAPMLRSTHGGAAGDEMWRRQRNLAMCGACVAGVALLALLGCVLSWLTRPAWLGPCVATLLAEATLVWLGAHKLHHQPTHGSFVAGVAALGSLLHAGSCHVLWTRVMRDGDATATTSGPASEQEALLLLWLVGLPTACLAAGCAYAWHEHSRDAEEATAASATAATPPSASAGLRIATATCVAALLGFVYALDALCLRRLALAFALLCLLALLLAAVQQRLRCGAGRLSPLWRRVAAVGVLATCVLGGAIFVVGRGAQTLAGVTLSAATLVGALLTLAASALRPRPGERWRHWRAPTVLPSFVLVEGEVWPADEAAECAAAAAAVALAWACWAAAAARPRDVGVLVGAATQLATLHAALSAVVAPRRALGLVASHVSAAALHECRGEALRAVLSGERPPPADVGAAAQPSGARARDRTPRAKAAAATAEVRNQAGALRRLSGLVGRAAADSERARGAVAAWPSHRPARREAAAAMLEAEAALREAHEAQARVGALLFCRVLSRGEAASAAAASDLLAWARVRVGGGAKVDRTRLARLSRAERRALEAASSGWRGEAEAKRRLGAMREGEERLAAEARALALAQHDERARRWEARAARAGGAATALRRRLVDLQAEARLLRHECDALAEALPHDATHAEVAAAALPDATADVAALIRASKAEAREAERNLGALRDRHRALQTRARGVQQAAAGAWLEERAANDAALLAVEAATYGLTRAQLDSRRLAQQLQRSLDRMRRADADAEALEGLRCGHHVELLAALAGFDALAQAALRKGLAQATQQLGALKQHRAALGRLLALHLRDADAHEARAQEVRARERAAERRRRRDEEEARRAARRDDEAAWRDEEVRRHAAHAADPLARLVAPLVQRAQAGGGTFEDADFPADDSTLPSAQRGAAWVRAAALVPAGTRPRLFGSDDDDDDGDGLDGLDGGGLDGAGDAGDGGGGAIDPRDISQGELGDCWFLSALSVVALRPELLRNCVVTRRLNAAGAFCARFHKNGAWQTVLIDDRFPAKHGSVAARAPARGQVAATARFASSKQRSELWVSLLEKAYAKLHGSYAALEGGYVDEAMVDLTGGVAGERLRLADERHDLAALGAKLGRYEAAGWLMGAGSAAGSDTATSERGIAQGHAYAVLGVRAVDEHACCAAHLVKLRNPCGAVEWSGDWCDASPLWTPRLRAKLGWHAHAQHDNDDGTFWMGLDDFCEHFERLYVCKLPSPRWHAACVDGEWRGATAGGCANYESCTHNPQFALTITRPTHVLLSLTQADPRMGGGNGDADGDVDSGLDDRADGESFAIGLTVCYKGGRRVEKLYTSDWTRTSGPYAYRRGVSVDVKLEMRGGSDDGAVATSYTLLPCTFKPGQERGFTIRLWSDQSCELEPL